ncbi:MAG: glutathione S-transferase, partial [Proteobacteria bacterium]|nr:glutathione S-transferase [Pseudomonadota bacterium]
AVKRAGNKLLFEDFRIADGLLANREFFFDHFTATDAYFFWCFRRAITFKLDLSSFPHCMAFVERLQQRPSLQQVLAHEKAVEAEFARTAQPRS